MDADEQTFEVDVIERSRERPVVVDFWADWCGPCKALTPVLEREVERRTDAVALVKVDVDANQGLASRYDVSGIPAVKAFRNGRVVAEFVGARSPQFVSDFLDGVTGPTEAERVLQELRESGAAPDVLAALERQDYERALELLLGELPAADGDRRDTVRRWMVALFADLGQDHPLSSRYRRLLATALY
jgi:thioredoxin